MSDTVIRVEGLGKKYAIAHKTPNAHNTLRDAIGNSAKALLQRLQGKGSKRADREEFWALKDVSFEVKRGEVVGIIGRNGAGKSTLLKILSRIIEPTTGKVTIQGRVSSLLEVGTGFHPELTGRENVYLNGAILGMGRREIQQKFDEIVDFAGVEKFIDTPVKHYSSGMYVRLAFSVAAHLESEILVIDEVLAVGDSSFQSECIKKLLNIIEKSNKTILFVSHNLAFVRRICNLAHLLDFGKIVKSAQTATVLDEYLKINESIQTQEVADSDRHISDVKAYFSAWSLSEFESKLHEYFNDESWMICLTLNVKETVYQAHFGLALRDREGILVWAYRSMDNDIILEITPGRYIVKVTLPCLPIKQGLYELTVTINDLEEGMIDIWCLTPLLKVINRKHIEVPLQWQGLLSTNGDLKISPVEQSNHLQTVISI